MYLILAVFCLHILPSSAEDHSADPDANRIRISILAKHLRLLREGSLKKITMVFPADSVIEDRTKGQWIAERTFEIVMQHGGVALRTDAGEPGRPVHVRVSGSKHAGIFTAHISGETRSYPLPLEITGNSKNLNIIVSEDPWRYARDSAGAEYGPLKDMHAEAAGALSLLILSRCHAALRAPAHTGFEFCDLTHCQVYRGLMPVLKKTDAVEADTAPRWTIAAPKPGEPMVFHARCGGRTLGMGVFGGASSSNGVRDWISGEGIQLCTSPGSAWKNSLPEAELAKLVFNRDPGPADCPFSIVYDRDHLRIDITAGKKSLTLAPEDFRLRVNRVKGWNFLKSNNYDIGTSAESESQRFVFSGMGLGHGAGLCQHGALALARLGYSRYEILEHYYPDISYIPGADSPTFASPYISYLIFNFKTGAIERCSHGRISALRMPPGSIFKLIVSLYLASNRIDLMRDYRYICSGKSREDAMPRRCWKGGGHGEMDLASAIPYSCNLYFASLYRHIVPADFKKYFDSFCMEMGLDARLPSIRDAGEFARVLSGLDFRVKFSMVEMIRLAQLFSSGTTDCAAVENMRRRIPAGARALIGASLENTFINGTASGDVHPYGSRYNSDPLIARLPGGGEMREPKPALLWGKTSTVLAGTNKIHSYGLFMGGDGRRGIIIIARKSNGHIAAQWAVPLLGSEIPNGEPDEK